MNTGLSGRLTKATIASPLTPLFLLAAILVGLLATITIPREEEPQISVPMVDMRVATPGLSAGDAVELVGKPLEDIAKSVDGVEHVYTQAQDHGLLVTARFVVGSRPEDAAIRLDARIKAYADRLPVGIGMPQVTVRGISDVPIVVLTLTPQSSAWDEAALYDLADKLRHEIAKVEDVGVTFITGGQPPVIRIVPDPARLAAAHVPLSSVMESVVQGGRSFPAGQVREAGAAMAVTAGQSLASAEEIRHLTLRAANGAPVLLGDVAQVVQGAAQDQARSWRWAREGKGWTMAPAVSIAIAKRNGANAVSVSSDVVARVEALKGTLIPAGVSVNITRNYGQSADEKANELIFHLALATVSIVILIGFAIGWREAGVTAIVIPTTIMLTLFASRMMGFSINRVSLFALIFSIGILVDDAIVMIENIARHWSKLGGAMQDGRSRQQAAIEAVAEVGNPTIIATLTVVAALLPMLFVSGLMGPYMAPIPINASAAMVFSFFVAVVIAPWLMIRFARQTLDAGHEAAGGGRLGAIYARYATRVIATRGSAKRFLWGVGLATLLACSMFYFKAVTVKLLPFDNKSEVQLVVDLPEGTALESTALVLEQVAAVARQMPEVTAMELYAGTAAPFNFNGLVRHYFLRSQPEMGDVMVALLPKDQRSRSSHAIAVDLRERLKAVALPQGGVIKVVETPPGPPVMATLLAEIYGPDEATRQKTARVVEQIFRSIPFIVDTDNSFGEPRPTLRLVPDRAKLDHYGVSEKQVLDSIGALMGGQRLAYASSNLALGGQDRQPVPIELALDQGQRQWNGDLAATPVAQTSSGQLLSLGELVEARVEAGGQGLYRRDGRGATMVMADLAGRYEAPIYGLLAVDAAIDAYDWKAHGLVKPAIVLHGQPQDESRTSLLWDGEWEITWVTFRDMGAAFMVALLAIYVLVVGQFGSFKLPLVILTPVPLTLIGIVAGHMLFGAPFTATSMIGFIALAGIIVRNSILLVDFIRHTATPDKPLRQVLIEAGQIRVKPIALTAAAAMIGASVILTDPIFQGLAISLLFGLASSTLLTLLVIPAIYVVLRDDGVLMAGGKA
ncbi:efflux RND transporter permease subunit [Novosphingobium umbonatum]|uniref:Efflux RND transporter permease subunit n=1 Tax=Novosphingobium umbonatum TaxID=1908524 RepID=A0A3S2VE06_9SPHN|nr:efflux RND transporter permease subunit [Novosphingobium umbonatum]RVU05695.1 efflux RND transporter permease subunit [Novosphingobium umbonatum]